MFTKLLNRLRHGNEVGIPKDAMKRLTTRPEHTPDAAELESRRYNLVFLYGNEMEGGRASPSGLKPLYKNVFTYDPFMMLKVQKGDMIAPVVVRPPTLITKVPSVRIFACETMKEAVVTAKIAHLRPAPIQGELFQLTADEVERLDKDYQNGVFFDRIRLRINVEHYTVSRHRVGFGEEARMSEALSHTKRVHMYVGRTEAFARSTILDSTELFKERPHNSNYQPRYLYTRQDGK